MASEPLRPAYLLTGSDRPKISRAVARLRGRFGEETIEHLYAETTTGEDAVAACNALGLFGGGGRLIIVDGVDKWKAADAQAVGGYLESPTPETVLALVAQELKSEAPLVKAVAKGGEVLQWDVAKRRLPGWVAEQFKRLGVQADRDASRDARRARRRRPGRLESEIEKLATWAGEDPVGARDVELLAVHARESPSWGLSDAWGARDVGEVLAVYESEVHRTRAVPRRLAARLARHARAQRAAARRGRHCDARHRQAAERPRVPCAQGARPRRPLLARRAERRACPAGRPRRRAQGQQPPPGGRRSSSSRSSTLRGSRRTTERGATRREACAFLRAACSGGSRREQRRDRSSAGARGASLATLSASPSSTAAARRREMVLIVER